jgi:hypothetical protein
MTDVMRISEELFRRLLFQTAALEAVTALSHDWAPRARADLPNFGLAAPEYFVTLCLIYTGEVGNGGHSQFFLNRGGQIARQVVVALDTLSLPAARDILQRACALFPDGHVPSKQVDVEAALDAMGASAGTQLERLDHQLSAIQTDVALLDYLRAHADEILMPERGLDDSAP